MANQANPNTYAVISRCPLEDGAMLRSLADEAGMTVRAYLAQMIKERVGDRDLTENERVWVAKRLESNKVTRARADAKTAAGLYRGKKKRGRHRKPWPKKGVRVIREAEIIGEKGV